MSAARLRPSHDLHLPAPVPLCVHDFSLLNIHCRRSGVSAPSGRNPIPGPYGRYRFIASGLCYQDSHPTAVFDHQAPQMDSRCTPCQDVRVFLPCALSRMCTANGCFSLYTKSTYTRRLSRNPRDNNSCCGTSIGGNFNGSFALT
jgi:hypothetical protein